MDYRLEQQVSSLTDLMNQVEALADSSTCDDLVSCIYRSSRNLCNEAVTYDNSSKLYRSEKLDNVFTSIWLGYPIMLFILGVIFYVTIAGANIPSSLIAQAFSWMEGHLTNLFNELSAPKWLHGVLILGFFRGTGWVISVMLPPMMIFFPIFALLENYGYLPRVAFNMDRLFKRAGAHGKQSLTMAMGFGCNAAAIMSTRIIESPRERMLAILTNNFVPCNGRWGTLILMASLFMAAGHTGGMATLISALTVVGIVLFGIVVTLVTSWVLSKTVLKGIPTHYTLELPPYRRPKFFDTIVRSTIDKSLSVLKRAVIIAAPAGILTWVLANITIGDTSILIHFVNFLDPFAKSLGLDGYILAAFIIGLPANEIVLPVLLMSYLSTGALIEIEDMKQLSTIFSNFGWTWLTALNMMLFSLLHFPCGTTLINIYKETKSKKWTFVAFVLPTGIAIAVTFITTQVVHFFGWV